MADTSKFTKKRRAEEGDLLSKLPEELLVNILLRIPTKEAMATMILSKQWTSIWRNLPSFEFKIKHDYCNNFGLILKKSLLQLDEGRSNFLKTLSINLDPTSSPCPADLLLDLGKYVEKAIDRKVANLKLMLAWRGDPIQLPKTLYTCKTLVNLSLSCKILLEDLSSESSLPCLKRLKLSNVVYKDEESVVSFLSSCPVLEVLSVKRGVVDNVKKFMVKVSSLRELSYTDYMWEVGDSDLVIDTPSVKRFKFRSYSSKAFSKIQTKMPLDDACIEITEGSKFPDDNLLKSMASLITLRMDLTDVMVPCCNTVKFSRLTECKIIPDYSDWLNPIMSLLANSPKLKKLSIEHNCQREDLCWPDSWKKPSCIPECLLSHFKVIEWKEYGGSKVEKQFITYILGNSMCLKMVKISILEFDQDFTRGKERRIMKDLKNIYRVSTTSHLVFI